MSKTLQELAEKARGWFAKQLRGNTDIWVVKDGAPKWVKNLCFAAHKDGSIGFDGTPGTGTMSPDDWRYRFIVDALSLLEQTEDPDSIYIDLDTKYPYTCDRLTWVASRLDRSGYCDQAQEDGLAREGAKFDELLAAGMVYEMEEVVGRVRTFLENMDEENEEAS